MFVYEMRCNLFLMHFKWAELGKYHVANMAQNKRNIVTKNTIS